jgi:glycosyltransferase involved in cell wall biosynthesis
MLAAIAEADVVLNTSLSEGMCGVVLEAMLLGTPVIARRNAGNQSVIVHGHTGLLYDEPAEMIEWGRALTLSAELRHRIARTAKARILSAHSPRPRARDLSAHRGRDGDHAAQHAPAARPRGRRGRAHQGRGA